MPASVDRNLLFGILALQLDFISRDALIAAMNTWILDKARSLGLILEDQGALRAENRALLDALVQRHLEMHNNDPQQSLAAISSLHTARAALQAIADADVQSSLANVTADQQNDSREATVAHAGRATLPPHARFQILRPHARGGLGEVFVAHDEELNREVALKEILERHAGQPERRARFLLEAEVTGSLEHPGIVPVYGLGTYGDGRPFYAMRFIKGDSLKDAIAAFHQDEPASRSDSERSLALRQLLGRFVDVCQAIAYAHSRGVLHRDLKPGNVMLGKYGETLVVDWGLAKVLGKTDVEATESALVGSGDSALTQAGQALGTPAYMSPEQAQGKLDELGPASDVYSLGATLYCLLTGQAPFTERDIGAVLGKVQKGAFLPPRQLNPRVPPALEAVCLKAMALRPADRYASPRELAGEIEHWLADEPVAAHRETLEARLARTARKRPAWTAGIAALLVTGVLALGVSTLLIGRAQRDTASALKDLEEEQRRRALAQVNALGDAAAGAVPAILDNLEANRAEVLTRLRERHQQEGDPAKKVRLALALLPVEPERVRDEIVERMLKADEPAEVLLARDGLAAHAAELAPRLWQKAGEAKTLDAERFRALVALAAFDSGDARWREAAGGLVEQLLGVNTLHLGTWVAALFPVRAALSGPLGAVFRDTRPERAGQRMAAAQVLARYVANEPETMYDLLLDADSKQYALLRPLLEADRGRAIARMHAELAKQPDYWNDAPLDAAWKPAGAAMVREIEQAGGIVAERFALCQALPLERLAAVTEGLRAARYRPLSVRPWQGGVALVWTRDGRDWQVEAALTPESLKERDSHHQKAGLIAADVAASAAKDGERYVALWRRGDGEKARLYVGLTEEQHRTETDALRAEGFVPARLQALQRDATRRYAGVWWKGKDKVEGENPVRVGEDEGLFAGHVADCAALLLDVHLGPARRYASVWRDEARWQAQSLHGLSAEAHLLRCRELAARGYRPVALSLAHLAGEKTAWAASVWHQPIALADGETLARRQATAAVALLHLGQTREVWPLWRHQALPTRRSWLVWKAGELGSDSRQLIAQLTVEKDDSARRALILALGEYTDKDLPASVHAPLVTKLLAWYRDDADPGVHAAIGWLLRHSKEGPTPRLLDWDQAKQLADIDRDLAGKPPRTKPEAPARRGCDGAGWYITREGQTMVMIRGPIEFRMGSPLWEPDRFAEERSHRRRIERSYALASTSVTVAQWQRFLKDQPQFRENDPKQASPEEEGPVLWVTWYAAAAYCNWLSEKEGIPPEQWCYPKKIGPGMKPYADHLRRTGYRLPSEAEWEYACRAGSESSLYFGSSMELLPRYAHYQVNSQGRARPVGQKRPNDLGLFDMHGNSWNWCGERESVYPQRTSHFPPIDSEDTAIVDDSANRSVRSGSFDFRAPCQRSSFRGFHRPSEHDDDIGLRVCRTLPAPR